jgi:steroid delta-isomerase-like uncharacterized protein
VSTEENKAIVRRWFLESWNEGRLEVADELIAPDYDSHPAPTDVNFGRGPAGQKEFLTFYRTAFPDVHMEIEDMVAEGDRVAVRWRGTGTHRGELMGFPASGKPATVTGMFISRVVGGKIVEGWANFDALGMMMQIGAIPMPAQGGAVSQA